MADPVRVPMTKIAGAVDALWAARRALSTARSAESTAEREARAGIARAAGVALDDLDFSNVACMASTPFGHVYHPTSAPSGIGRRHCVLCGLDDFDF